MQLDRSLIKSQAKEIIKGKVFKLFVVILIVTALMSGASVITSTITTIKSANQAKRSLPQVSDFSTGEYDIENFDVDSFMQDYTTPAQPEQNVKVTFGSGLTSILALVFMPLAVTLAGLFLLLIRGEDKTIGDGLAYVFKTAFDKNYFNRFLLMLLQGIFTMLWSLLFIIPGIIYMYKVYFAVFIMAENPEIGWKEALDTSKKMTNGHKGELFVLDLSFIPWYLLVGITFGIASIYVLPYIETVHALYYQNFKQRALQEGAVSEADFLSNAQKLTAQGQAFPPAQPVQQAQPVYQPVQQPTYQQPVQPQQPVYQPPVQPQQPVYQPPVQPAEPVYQPPVQPAAPVAPAEPVIPAAPAEPVAPVEPAVPAEPVDFYNPPSTSEWN